MRTSYVLGCKVALSRNLRKHRDVAITTEYESETYRSIASKSVSSEFHLHNVKTHECKLNIALNGQCMEEYCSRPTHTKTCILLQCDYNQSLMIEPSACLVYMYLSGKLSPMQATCRLWCILSMSVRKHVSVFASRLFISLSDADDKFCNRQDTRTPHIR